MSINAWNWLTSSEVSREVEKLRRYIKRDLDGKVQIHATAAAINFSPIVIEDLEGEHGSLDTVRGEKPFQVSLSIQDPPEERRFTFAHELVHFQFLDMMVDVIEREGRASVRAHLLRGRGSGWGNLVRKQIYAIHEAAVDYHTRELLLPVSWLGGKGKVFPAWWYTERLGVPESTVLCQFSKAHRLPLVFSRSGKLMCRRCGPDDRWRWNLTKQWWPCEVCRQYRFGSKPIPAVDHLLDSQ